MSLYEYVYYVSCSQKFSVKLYILHEGTYIRVSTISVPTVLQVAFKRFLRFRKFRLVNSSTRGVMLNLFTHCLHFVGHWQTVLIQIRRHITKVASDQVLRCCSLEILNKKNTTKNNTPKVVMSSSKRLKLGNSIRHVWINIKCVNEYFLEHSFMKHYMYHFVMNTI